MEPEYGGAETSDSGAVGTLVRPVSSMSRLITCRIFKPNRGSATHTLPWPSIHTRRSNGEGEKSMALIAPGPLSTSGRLEGDTSSATSSAGIGIASLSSPKIFSIAKTVMYPDSDATAQYALDGDQAVAKYPITWVGFGTCKSTSRIASH